MPSKLSKWGNSLGVRVPSHIAERAGLQCGDQLYIRLLDSGDILVRAASSGRGPTGLRSSEWRRAHPCGQNVR